MKGRKSVCCDSLSTFVPEVDSKSQRRLEFLPSVTSEKSAPLSEHYQPLLQCIRAVVAQEIVIFVPCTMAFPLYYC